MNTPMFSVAKLLDDQMEQVAHWHKEPFREREAVSFEEHVELQNHFNFELWHQEDLARDPEADDAQIAKVKRKIDQLNQKRHDQIEVLDEWILRKLHERNVVPEPDSTLNSETPGSIIDRLSINALKIFHMNEQVDRSDVDQTHIDKCQQKLAVLKEQRHDLSQCLTELRDCLERGEKRLKVYRQMKMYNDQTLNPVLYRHQTGASKPDKSI